MTSVPTGSRPIRVLHLRDSPWVDGPGRTIIESGSHFDPRRVEYHIGVLVPEMHMLHPMIEEADRRGLAAHAILDHGGLDRQSIKVIIDLVDQHEVQVLHTSDLRTRLFGLFARRFRPALLTVTTAHGWIANDARRKALRQLDMLLLRANNHIIFVSDATRSRVPRQWLPDERVTVLRNALDLDAYSMGTTKREHRGSTSGREVNVLNVGRLSPEKGQDLLLRAIAALLPEFPGIRLHVAGVGPMESTLRSLARDLGIDSRVTFHGFVRDMPALYSMADLVVQSSLTEGLPNVILEAAYLRVPIIATDVGGTREVIEHGYSAWLIPPRSIVHLVNGMRRYLDNSTVFVRMANCAHDRIVRDFSFQTRTDRMTDIYERCVLLRKSSDSRKKATP